MFSEKVQEVVPLASWYGLLSTRSSTFETETLSEALPDTVTVPASVAPAAGLAIATVGRCVSLALKVTVLLAQAWLPEESVALAKSELNPVTAFMTGKIRINGSMMLLMQLQPALSELAKEMQEIDVEY